MELTQLKQWSLRDLRGKLLYNQKKMHLKKPKNIEQVLLFGQIDWSWISVGAAICWRGKTLDLWQEKSVFLGKNKEVLDAELLAISDVLDIAAKETLNIKNVLVTIFCDSQEALRVIKHPPLHERNRFLEGFINEKTKRFESNGYHVTTQWIPRYSGLVGNDKANQAAKNRAERGR